MTMPLGRMQKPTMDKGKAVVGFDPLSGAWLLYGINGAILRAYQPFAAI